MNAEFRPRVHVRRKSAIVRRLENRFLLACAMTDEFEAIVLSRTAPLMLMN